MAATLRTPARTASPPARARLAERLFVQVDNTWMVVFRILFGLIAGWEVYSAALFCLGFAYSFLLEATRYLNHFYLIALLAGLLAVVPAHQRLSVDAWQRPSLRSDTAPAWTLWLLRFQVGIVSVFGGVAKLNGDWLRGEPMRTWLAARTGLPMIGRWFESEWLVWGFSDGGLLLDLAIVPLLLMRRTRAIALVALLIFNGLNDRLFSIGVFPYLALGAALLFCDPPRRWSLPDAPAPAAPEPAARTALRVGSDHRGVNPCPARRPRRRPAGGPAAPPGVSGRLELDRGGPPVRVAHEAAQQVGAGHLHRAGARHRSDLGGRLGGRAGVLAGRQGRRPT